MNQNQLSSNVIEVLENCFPKQGLIIDLFGSERIGLLQKLKNHKILYNIAYIQSNIQENQIRFNQVNPNIQCISNSYNQILNHCISDSSIIIYIDPSERVLNLLQPEIESFFDLLKMLNAKWIMVLKKHIWDLHTFSYIRLPCHIFSFNETSFRFIYANFDIKEQLKKNMQTGTFEYLNEII